MRKMLLFAIAALTLGLPVSVLRAQDNGLKAQKELLKAKQKEERAVLKLHTKNWNQSLKGQPISKAERLRAKHQMAREARELRERQKDEEQDFKDRKRQLKEIQKQL